VTDVLNGFGEELFAAMVRSNDHDPWKSMAIGGEEKAAQNNENK